MSNPRVVNPDRELRPEVGVFTKVGVVDSEDYHRVGCVAELVEADVAVAHELVSPVQGVIGPVSDEGLRGSAERRCAGKEKKRVFHVR